MRAEFIRGADLSTLEEEEACGARYYDNGTPGDAMHIMKTHGMNFVRLRLWNDPYGRDGAPYGAGTSDLPRTIRLAARAAKLGLPWMLDFHYSDFWADPAKQFLPKAWAELSGAELEDAVFSYTAGVLKTLKERDLLPAVTAVGNEITNGLLWPEGERRNAVQMTRLITAGIRAVREAAPGIKVMLHLDQGGCNELYRDWFGSYLENGGADFDIIGLSYYPYWHGTVADLKYNLDDLAVRFGKPLIVAETAMAFTYEPYTLQGEAEREKKGLAAGAAFSQTVPYPATPQGQRHFIRDVAAAVRSVPDGLGLGFFWWEPAWIPVSGCGWATEAARQYIRAEGPGGNEWANQTLFDYCGNALPALLSYDTL